MRVAAENWAYQPKPEVAALQGHPLGHEDLQTLVPGWKAGRCVGVWIFLVALR